MEQDISMLMAGGILGVALLVFTLGKSPVFRVDRAGAAIIGSVAMVGSGVLSFDEAMRAVDFRTIIILFSMMVVVANLKLAGLFELIGNMALQRVTSKRSLLFLVVMASGLLSALAINDVVCLLFTPIVLLVCRKGGCNPLPHLLGVAMASNLGSAGTLLGNPQNILIGSLSGMSFYSYFFTASPVALIGLVVTYGLLSACYRQELSGAFCPEEKSQSGILVHPYLVAKSLLVLGFIVAAYIAGVDLVLAAGLGAAILLITRRVNPNKVYVSVDFNLLVIFTGLFVIVGGVEKSGLMTYLLQWLPAFAPDRIGFFALLTLLVSNLVSNVPAVLLLKFFIPAAQAEAWWKALALFSTLAGNLTITGSIANLIVAEIAKRNNVVISAKEYFKVGFPLTLLTTVIALAWIWAVG